MKKFLYPIDAKVPTTHMWFDAQLDQRILDGIYCVNSPLEKPSEPLCTRMHPGARTCTRVPVRALSNTNTILLQFLRQLVSTIGHWKTVANALLGFFLWRQLWTATECLARFLISRLCDGARVL